MLLCFGDRDSHHHFSSKKNVPSTDMVGFNFFQFTIYVSVLESQGENPLLDSRFPDVSGKGRGYQLEACSEGTHDWPELRKVSIWQTISALEQEFREKAAQFAQEKRTEENDDETDLEAEKTETEEKSSIIDVPDEKVVNDNDSSSPRAEEKSCITKAESKTSEKESSFDPAFRPKQALPHHLPKMDALSHKLDGIRKTMGESVSAFICGILFYVHGPEFSWCRVWWLRGT